MLSKVLGWLILIVALLIFAYGISQIVVGYQHMDDPNVGDSIAGGLTFFIGFGITTVGAISLLPAVFLIRRR